MSWEETFSRLTRDECFLLTLGAKRYDIWCRMGKPSYSEFQLREKEAQWRTS